MEAKFYLKDDEYFNAKGKPVVEKDLLFFSLSRKMPGTGYETAYDNRATPEHVKNYPSAFETFRTLNPDYVLPWEDKEHLQKDGPHTASKSAFQSKEPVEAQ